MSTFRGECVHSIFIDRCSEFGSWTVEIHFLDVAKSCIRIKPWTLIRKHCSRQNYSMLEWFALREYTLAPWQRVEIADVVPSPKSPLTIINGDEKRLPRPLHLQYRRIREAFWYFSHSRQCCVFSVLCDAMRADNRRRPTNEESNCTRTLSWNRVGWM